MTTDRADDWVPVGERLPAGPYRTDHRVLIWLRDEQDVQCATLTTLGNWSTDAGFFFASQVTHWRDLPEPPKGAG